MRGGSKLLHSDVHYSLGWITAIQSTADLRASYQPLELFSVGCKKALSASEILGAESLYRLHPKAADRENRIRTFVSLPPDERTPTLQTTRRSIREMLQWASTDCLQLYLHCSWTAAQRLNSLNQLKTGTLKAFLWCTLLFLNLKNRSRINTFIRYFLPLHWCAALTVPDGHFTGGRGTGSVIKDVQSVHWR